MGIKMFEAIQASIKQPLFSSFSEFSNAVLMDGKLDNQSVLSLGTRSANLSQAFALAYRCALQTLLPELNTQNWAAMCVSEAQGNHPKQVQTILSEQGLVTGEKSFVTMANLAKQLIVLAKAGEKNGLPLLKAALVESQSDRVCVQTLPALKMLSELPHGIVTFENTRCKILEGDGYSDYSKRFRTLEDTFVLMCAATFILSHGWRSGMNINVMQKALALLTQVQSYELKDSPWLHICLAESFKQFDALVEAFESQLDLTGEAFTQCWQQDKKIFLLAASARKARYEKAVLSIETLKGVESK